MEYNEMHFRYLHCHLTLLINFRDNVYISYGEALRPLLNLQRHLHI